MNEIAATCVDRAVVLRGLKNVGVTFDPSVPLDEVLREVLSKTSFGDGAISSTDDLVTFTGGAMKLGEGLIRAGALREAPAPRATGFSGWTALGVAAAAVLGAVGVSKLTSAKTKKRRRKK